MFIFGVMQVNLLEYIEIIKRLTKFINRPVIDLAVNSTPSILEHLKVPLFVHRWLSAISKLGAWNGQALYLHFPSHNISLLLNFKTTYTMSMPFMRFFARIVVHDIFHNPWNTFSTTLSTFGVLNYHHFIKETQIKEMKEILEAVGLVEMYI